MQSRFLISLCWLGLATALCVAGCDAWKGRDADVAEEPVPTAPSLPVASIGGSRQEKLTFNLPVGGRFPLLKTVTQTLEQPSVQGTSVIKSTLELQMAVIVQEIRPVDPAKPKDPSSGAKRLQVKYHRVRFSQQFPNPLNNVAYDSENPGKQIPLEALGYHGLKDNTFEFWLGADNQIIQIIDFDKFIDRCLLNVPEQARVQVRSFLAATSGADGIANFIDDSIGLLPARAVRVNETWSRERTIPQPVPMHISSRYTLQRITPDIADIDILGTITPSTTYGPPNQFNRDVNVFVTGGNCFGSCTIDRRTGLPMQSRVEQSMLMNVRLPAGLGFQQKKTTQITIRAFPEQAPTSASAAPPQAPRR